MRRWSKTVLQSVLATSMVLVVISAVLGVTPVWGAKTHLFQASFGPDGTASSSFGQPGPLAVDQSTGGVYVADFASQSVQKFNSTHEPEAFTGISPNIVGGKLTGFVFSPEAPSAVNQIAVNSTSHDFYVVGESHPVKAYQSDGEPANFTVGPGVGTNEIGGTEICGVAVDANGAIYVSEAAAVKVYAATGAPLATIFASATCNLAVDSHGTAYLTAFATRVEKFIPSEFPVTTSTTYASGGTVDPNPSRSVAVDPNTNHLYVDEHSQIAEYDEAGTLVARFGTAEPGALSASEGIAVNGASGRPYVSDAKGKRQVEIFGPTILLPDVTTSEATSPTPTSATLNGTVNPAGVPVTECVFLYGETGAYGHSVPCAESPAEIGAGELPVPVHAAIAGLLPNTNYHFRLLAANANGGNRGEDQTFLTPSPPVIDSASAGGVTATSADLQAEINPLRSATSYRFEYGPSVSYGTSIPVPDADIGSGAIDQVVSQHIPELTPATLYHYRVVAHNAFGTATGPDQTFLTQPAGGGEAALPDGRQWELVSPTDKHGAGLLSIGEEGVIQASSAGDGITYLATAPTELEPEGNAGTVQVLSTRGSGGWGSRDIAIPRSTVEGLRAELNLQYQFFSSDLSFSVAQPDGPFLPSLSPEGSEQTAYLRSDYSGGREVCPTVAQKAVGVSCYRPLVTGKAGYANVPEGNIFTDVAEGGKKKPVFAGATPDLGHVIVESPYSLTLPGKTRAPGPGLYEWTAGKLTFIGESDQHGFRSVSSDGSRVVFTPNALSELRLGDIALGQTLRLDVPEPICLAKAKCGEGKAEPVFQGATGDGSKVFFTDTQRLTADAGTEGTGPDLYECDLVVEAGALRCHLHDLTPPGVGKEDANVQGGVLGTSSDGSWVYFVATGVLTGVENAEKAKAVKGADNLYLRHGGGETSLVAVLRGDDYPDWSVTSAVRPTRVSANGDWLAFMSDASLTGYDNRDVVSGHLDEEVFLFHASTGALVCASCNPTAARPAGVEYRQIETIGEHDPSAGGYGVWNQQQWIAANVPGWTPYAAFKSVYQSRFLSGLGRLFFNSSDGLVSQDVNRTEDVYQYEPPGVGGCTSGSVAFSVRSGGCVALVSSGRSAEESEFLDASETGGDVFFLTAARLSSRDFDTSVDVYDAHECTSVSPCLPVAVAQPPPCGTGDSCKPSPSPQPPIFGASGSATFSGAGNPVSQLAVGGGRSLTSAQRLAKALRACRKQHGRRRVLCELQARRRYAPHHKKVKRSSGLRSGGKG